MFCCLIKIFRLIFPFFPLKCFSKSFCKFLYYPSFKIFHLHISLCGLGMSFHSCNNQKPGFKKKGQGKGKAFGLSPWDFLGEEAIPKKKFFFVFFFLKF